MACACDGGRWISGSFDARAIVRREMPAVSEASVIGFVEALVPIVGAYGARPKGKRVVDDAFIADVAGRDGRGRAEVRDIVEKAEQGPPAGPRWRRGG